MGTDQIGRMVTAAATRDPHRAAIRYPGGWQRTYGELDERTTRLANALLASGLKPGDRVAAWLDTCPQYIELYFAIAKAGLVLVPVNSMFTEHEAAYQVEDSQSSAMFYASEKTEAAHGLAQRYGLGLLVPIADATAVESEYETFLATGGTELPPEPDDAALYIIAYTSGTTGRPKGAMVTHRTLKQTVRQHAHSYRTPSYSTCIYHSNMSFVATVLGLIMGHIYITGTIVLAGKVKPEQFLDIIESEGGTFTFVPSPWIVPMTELAAKYPEKWQRIRTFVHSASKAHPEDLRRWAEVVGHRFLEGWGMSEVSGALVTVTDVQDVLEGSDAMDLYASAGRPVLETVIRVVDELGQDLPHDGVSVGELIVQTPSLVVGYWNKPEATASALREGWYHTGDLGSIDPAGYIYVTERRNDLIVSGGMNVYPSEIEQRIAELPGVQDVAVIGVPHPKWGQTGVAVIVRGEDSGLTAEIVIAHCRKYLATYKKPSDVVFVDELPRTASNKVLKRVLRDQLQDRFSEVDQTS